MTILVAAAQIKCDPKKPDSTLKRAEDMVRQAAAQGASIICLPELFDSGYDLKAIRAGRAPQGEARALFTRITHQLNISVIFGTVGTLSQGKRLNQVLCASANGSIFTYNKTHLFQSDPNFENETFAPGEARKVWDLKGTKVGPMICYDIRFPELARALTLDGCQVLTVSSAWPHARREALQTLCRARAIENQLFVVSSNQVGENLGGHFGGNSMIVAPDGDILASLDDREEGIIVSKLDFSRMQKLRDFMPCLSHRRPEIYSR